MFLGKKGIFASNEPCIYADFEGSIRKLCVDTGLLLSVLTDSYHDMVGSEERQVMTMLQRFLYWMRRGKGCRRCCMKCKYYQRCRADVLGEVIE